MFKKRRRSAGQNGAALIVVMLMLIVLAGLGYMALYDSDVNILINTSLRGKELARESATAGANYIINNLFNPASFSLVGVPAAAVTTGFLFGNKNTHPLIGSCLVLSGTCGSANGAGTAGVNDMCCFRTGPFTDTVQFNMTESGVSVGKVRKTRSIAAAAIKSRLVDIPLTADFQHIIYDFMVTGGGPFNSVSVIHVMLEAGPIGKRGGSGTMYGSPTSASYN